MIGIVNPEKRRKFNISFSGIDGKEHTFDAIAIDFQISYRIGRHLFSIKMKEIIKKLKIKYRVGLG